MTPNQYRDVLAAHEDAISASFGNPPLRPHPNADAYGDRPLSDFAEAMGRMEFSRRNINEERSRPIAMSAGMVTKDFGNVIGAAAHKLAQLRYTQMADHLAICADQVVPNFLAVNFPSMDVDLNLAKTGEGGETLLSKVVVVGGQTAQLDRYARTLFVSRQAIINDDTHGIGVLFSALGTSAGVNEAKLVCATLEGNPTLSDGQAMFVASNIVAQVLSASALEAALKALRLQQTAAGNVANLSAAVIAVSAGLELTATQLLKSAGMENRIRVVVLPWLADGRWYVFADPRIAPVLGRLVLKNSVAPITVGPVVNGETFKSDGIGFLAVACLGIVPLGRIGIVKGGV